MLRKLFHRKVPCADVVHPPVLLLGNSNFEGVVHAPMEECTRTGPHPVSECAAWQPRLRSMAEFALAEQRAQIMEAVGKMRMDGTATVLNPCPRCEMLGWVDCKECGGSGDGERDIIEGTLPCVECGGTGIDTCPVCKGACKVAPCGYQPLNTDYVPCTREKGHRGPCAHALVNSY